MCMYIYICINFLGLTMCETECDYVIYATRVKYGLMTYTIGDIYDRVTYVIGIECSSMT